MLRKPRKRELKVIRSALGAFGSIDFLDENEVLIKEDNKDVYALSKDLARFLELFKIDFVSAGIKIGEAGSRRFRFTVEGAYYLARRNKKRVYVNERGEMLFLYGRDIFRGSIVDVTGDVRENDVVFVCNRRGDILGIGRIRFDADRIWDLDDDRIVVENLVDRGEYLRKQRLYNAF